MFARRKMSDSKLNEVSCQAAKELNKLLETSTDSNLKVRALGNLRRLLECMVLGTYQYDVAVARVNNAQRYLQSGEPGAAHFEVRMLFGGLQHCLREEENPTRVDHAKVNRSPILASVKSVAAHADNLNV